MNELAVRTLTGVFLIAAALIRVPYYSLGPGSIRATEPLVDLGGGERDPAAGTVDFATVSVNGRSVWSLRTIMRLMTSSPGSARRVTTIRYR